MHWPLRLRPLPRFVAPFRDETISSYLPRLAAANRLAPAALRALLAGSDRKDAPVPLARLAAVTGMPHAALAHAMPQICTAGELIGLHIQNQPRARKGWSFAACRRCTAGRPVTRWALHDDVVCGRHRRWISEDQAQPRPDRPAGDPHRAPPPPAADPPARPGHRDAGLPRRAPHLHRLAPRRHP